MILLLVLTVVSQIQALTVLAQLQQRDEQNLRRYLLALDVLNQAEADAKALINDVRTAIAEHHAAKLALLQAFRRTWGASALACFDAIQAEFEASVAALVREHYAGLSSA